MCDQELVCVKPKATIVEALALLSASEPALGVDI